MRHIVLAAFILGPGLAFAQNYQPGGMQGGQNFAARFAAANTTHDGHLTLAQAQTADLKMVVTHFTEIDADNKGYVTIDDIRTWRQSHPFSHGGAPQGDSPGSSN